ncbi:DUF4349 domain-containing protein [Natronomonas sp. EA1]|uniref:DUF4349 domain-containing protein n=1 Tax=Natronomonas sp. EA1 TaxID=3421655 RepID=UPI003EC03764
MGSHRLLGAVAVVALVVLAGCSGGGLGASSNGGGGADLTAGGSDGGRAVDAAAEERERSANADTTALQAQRAIIRTGQVSLTVDSFTETSDRIASLARSSGGFVASSSRTTHSRDNETWTTGRLVIRVPSDEFQSAFTEIQTMGTVESAESDTTDVTDQLVDLNARLENLRAERDRLRTLYENANETEDVLAVSERLSEVQEEIERLEAQKRQLENRVAYSTITVELHEEPPEREPEPGYADVGLITAFLASIDGVVLTIRTITVTVAYALPYLLVFGLPVTGVAAVVYRRRRP